MWFGGSLREARCPLPVGDQAFTAAFFNNIFLTAMPCVARADQANGWRYKQRALREGLLLDKRRVPPFYGNRKCVD
jgi:hypothetical protein